MATASYTVPPSPPQKSPLRGARPYPAPQLRVVQVPPLLSKSAEDLESRSVPHPPQRLVVPKLRPRQQEAASRVPLAHTNVNSSGAEKVHRGNRHHLHLFSESEAVKPAAQPYPTPVNFTRPRVSSLPVVSPPDVSKSFAASSTSAEKPRSNQQRRSQRVLSMPVIPTEQHRTKQPAAARHPVSSTQRVRPQHFVPAASLQSPIAKVNYADLVFAPVAEPPTSNTWTKAVKRVIGIEGIKETAEEALKAGSGTQSPISSIPARLNLFSRKNKYNLNDAIYGSIGKSVEIPLDSIEKEDSGLMIRHSSCLDDESESSDSDFQSRRMPSARQPQWKREQDIRRRTQARTPVRSGSIVRPDHSTAIKTDGSSVTKIVRKKSTISIRSKETAHTVRRKPVPVSPVSQSTEPSTSGRVKSMPVVPSSYGSSEGDGFNWPDLPPVAPLNIRKNSSSAPSTPSSCGSGSTYMELGDLQALVMSIKSCEPEQLDYNAQNLGPDYSTVGDLTRRSAQVEGQKIDAAKNTGAWPHTMLDLILVNDPVTAIRKNKGRSRLALKRVQKKRSATNAKTERSVGIPTARAPVIASAHENERIAEAFVRLAGTEGWLRLLAQPVDIVRFIVTLILFPPMTSFTPSQEEIERKTALRSTILDVAVLAECGCILWLGYFCCMTVASFFSFVGVLFYPLFAIGRVLSTGFSSQ